jgi:RloB-like protein
MKRRKTKRTVRRTNPHILILCDGLTEKNYFTAIKQDPEYKRSLAALSVDICEAKNRDPLQIVNEAIKRKKKARQEGNAYDHVWVVYDHDNRPARMDAYDLAGSKDIRVAFSSIAYEYWYLLHFKQTAQAFQNANALIKALRKFFPEYQKAGQNDFVLLKDRLPDACNNAAWLKVQTKHFIEEGKHLTELNPFTDVDQLVRFLVSTVSV